MGMLDLLLGRQPGGSSKSRPAKSAPQSTHFGASQMSQQGASAHTVRRELLKLVLRETLTRNGIPGTWIAVDLLRTTNSQREHGIHVRFLVRQWDPRLMTYGVAFEHEFVQRLLLLDPLAPNWLMGFSWQFTLDDASACPPMPHPATWTSTRDFAAMPAAARVPQPEPQSADVIAGPVTIQKPLDEVRADLERLLAARDEDIKRHSNGEDNFDPTRPASL